jgi:hypothetical protein
MFEQEWQRLAGRYREFDHGKETEARGTAFERSRFRGDTGVTNAPAPNEGRLASSAMTLQKFLRNAQPGVNTLLTPKGQRLPRRFG